MTTNTAQKQNRILTIAGMVVLLACVFWAGMAFGQYTNAQTTVQITNKDGSAVTTADFAPFWKVWSLINEKYPSASKIDDQKRVYGAIQGLMGSLNDPYSQFFPPDESKSFDDLVRGDFGGVGMEVGIKDKVLTVIAPMKGTPAYKAGIKSGDKILKIDNTVTNTLTIDEAIRLIRGEKGTTVTVTIFHAGDKEPKEIKLIRDTITIPTLDTEKRKDGIFVIRLYSFSQNAPELFQNALREYIQSGYTKMILDLRGNPGGYLDAAVDMASWFLPEGKVIVSEDFGTNKTTQVYRSKGYDLFKDKKLSMVILVDGGSASASEILSGALNEHGIAKLVGDQTYGKGSVQELIPVTKAPLAETSVKITVAKWLTPNGVSISEKGLTPDYKVLITKKDSTAKQDPQLKKAVSLLLGK